MGPLEEMFAATDVHYWPEGGAQAALLAFETLDDDVEAWSRTLQIDEVAEYEPGSFYKRELPCLLPLLRPLVEDGLDVLFVDGYVDLGPDKPGLGRHLAEALAFEGTVIGVAKTRFATAPVQEVLRGQSTAPLFVTAAGPESEQAAEWVRKMHGPHRLPTLLKSTDRLARGLVPPRPAPSATGAS